MTIISTKKLTRFPKPQTLKRLFQSLAMLDTIMSPEWEYRYYSYNAYWGTDETMGSIRNGSGDEVFALFNLTGCFVKGFSHEHWQEKLSPDEYYKNVPKAFSSAVSEPAFSPSHVTFCYWCNYDDPFWKYAKIILPDRDDPDGSKYLLSGLDGDPKTYQSFVLDYYEKEIPLTSISAIYNHEILTQEIINLLNPDIKISDIREDIIEIKYPI